MFHQKLCFYYGSNHQVDEKNGTFYLDHRVLRNFGLDQAKVHGNTNSNTSKLEIGVSHAHKCITQSVW
jgi:hypothetical protein